MIFKFLKLEFKKSGIIKDLDEFFIIILLWAALGLFLYVLIVVYFEMFQGWKSLSFNIYYLLSWTWLLFWFILFIFLLETEVNTILKLEKLIKKWNISKDVMKYKIKRGSLLEYISLQKITWKNYNSEINFIFNSLLDLIKHYKKLSLVKEKKTIKINIKKIERKIWKEEKKLE